MTEQRKQYSDYTSYLKLKESNNLYNLAIHMIEEQSTDYPSLARILQKVIILNSKNVDAVKRLQQLVTNGNITEHECIVHRNVAMQELLRCYSATDLRKKY
jgi:hypothetical protein